MKTDWEQEIRALEAEARAAFLAADLPVLQRLWSDDLLVNSPLNRVNNKEQLLDLLRSGRIRHLTFDCEIEHIARFGDTVVIMGNDQVSDPPDGAVSHRRYTNVWRREEGVWRTIARHANVISREPARSSADATP